MRTHCITIDLANQGRRQVRARFDGGRMSSDGGALLLQAVNQRIVAVEELQRIVGQIRQRWPRVRVVVRGDAGFCRDELMAWCEAAEGVDYVFGLAQNARQQRRSRSRGATRGGQGEVCSPCANSPSRTGRVPRNRSRLTQIWLREGIPERQGREISCRPASNSPLPGPVTPKSEAA